MLNQDFLRTLSSKAARIFPATTSAKQEIESKLYHLLQDNLSKLNLVTREEFDSQLVVLTRAQQAIDALEEKVLLLESQITGVDQSSDN